VLCCVYQDHFHCKIIPTSTKNIWLNLHRSVPLTHNITTEKLYLTNKQLLGLFICVCIALCTTVTHNIAQNRPDNFLSYPPDNHLHKQKNARKMQPVQNDQCSHWALASHVQLLWTTSASPAHHSSHPSLFVWLCWTALPDNHAASAGTQAHPASDRTWNKLLSHSMKVYNSQWLTPTNHTKEVSVQTTLCKPVRVICTLKDTWKKRLFQCTLARCKAANNSYGSQWKPNLGLTRKSQYGQSP